MAALLVVDDDADVLDMLCAALTAMGHTVERACSGLAALDILDQGGRFDLLLTDIVMPGLHGFNLARMARLRHPALKVLYMSGHAETDQVLRDIAPKFGKLLHKPVRPDDLRSEVEQALAGEGS